MRVVLAAAGVGKRLGALGRVVPKAFLPYAGVPLLAHAWKECELAGIPEAYALISSKDTIATDLFRRTAEAYPSTVAVHARLVDPSEELSHHVEALHISSERELAICLVSEVCPPQNPILPMLAEVVTHYGGAAVAIPAVSTTNVGEVSRVRTFSELQSSSDRGDSRALGRYVFAARVFDKLPGATLADKLAAAARVGILRAVSTETTKPVRYLQDLGA